MLGHPDSYFGPNFQFKVAPTGVPDAGGNLAVVGDCIRSCRDLAFRISHALFDLIVGPESVAGTGTINGNVNNSNGGKVSPGALGVPGVLTVVGKLHAGGPI